MRSIPVLVVGFAIAAFAPASISAQTFYPILQNGDFETGRGAAGEVDLPGGQYSAGFRSGVADFVPGGPGDTGPYGYQDWWWGDDGFYTGFPDPVGYGAAAAPVDWNNTITPFSGARMLRFKGTGARNGNGCDIYQDIDVSSHATEIDAGGAQLHFDAQWNKVDEDSAAIGEIAAYFSDASKTQIGTPGYVAITPDLDQSTWEQSSGSQAVPVGTRYVRFRLVARGQSHYFVDSQGNSHWNTPYFGTYADDVSLILEIPLPPPVPVAVANASLELPVLGGPGTDSTSTPQDWTSFNNNRRHLWDDGTRFTDPIPDGNQVATLRGNNRFSQTTGESILANSAYVLQVAAGTRLDNTAANFFESYLFSGTGPNTQRVAQTRSGQDFDTAAVAPAGTFGEARAIFTVLAGDPNVGDPLGIYFRTSGVTGSSTSLDDVRLTRHPIGTVLSVPITNPSFEANVLADGTAASIVPTGWVGVGGAANRLVSNLTVPTNYNTQAATDGENVVSFNGSAGFSQRLSGQSLQPDMAYVFSFDLGNRLDEPTDPTARVDIVVGPGPNIGSAGNTIYKRWITDAEAGLVIPGNPVAAGEFRRVSFTFETDAAPPAGDIWIRIRGNGGATNFADFDNVSLVYYPKP